MTLKLKNIDQSGPIDIEYLLLDNNILYDSDSDSSLNSLNSNHSEYICRICFGKMNENELQKFCSCSGYVGNIHKICLLKWILEKKTSQCEICKYNYKIEKTYKKNYCTFIFFIIFVIWIGITAYFIFLNFSEYRDLIIFFTSMILFITFLNLRERKYMFYKLKTLNILEVNNIYENNANNANNANVNMSMQHIISV